MKSPVNYVGNKYRYMKQINNLLKGRKFIATIDLFMGSGNLLLNLEFSVKHLIGIDIIPLVPNLYNSLKNLHKPFSVDEIQEVIDEYKNFIEPSFYYQLRDEWNSYYLSSKEYSRRFIICTILLLKMCSNSMVRFNSRGEFNQGFRGVRHPQGFFRKISVTRITDDLNFLISELKSKNYNFYSCDSIEILNDLPQRGCLIIADPPYILKGNMYDMAYDTRKENQLLKFLSNTGNSFILFNYLKRKDETHNELKQFAQSFNMITLNRSTQTGQASKGRKLDIKEVLIYKI